MSCLVKKVGSLAVIKTSSDIAARCTIALHHSPSPEIPKLVETILSEFLCYMDYMDYMDHTHIPALELPHVRASSCNSLAQTNVDALLDRRQTIRYEG